MNFFYKILVLFISFWIGTILMNNADEPFLTVCCFLVSITFLFIVIHDIIDYINKLLYGDDFKLNYSDDDWSYYWGDYDNRSYNTGKVIYGGSQKDITKEIVKNININTNIIEIGSSSDIKDDCDDEIEVDNTKPNKPTIHKSALENVSNKMTKSFTSFSKNAVVKSQEQTKKSNVSVSNIKSDCIFISNKEIDKSTEKIYKILLHILKKQNLNPKQQYAFMQSIFYIDIYSSSVTIYIDENILKQNGLSEANLNKEKVAEYIKKLLHDNELKIYFENITHTSLLNYYYLKNKKS